MALMFDFFHCVKVFFHCVNTLHIKTTIKYPERIPERKNILSPKYYSMKRLLLLFCLTAMLACKKEEEKRCYICTTYNEITYKDGSTRKDTIEMEQCGTVSFINKYIQNGTYDGETWEKANDKDTVYYYLKAKSECVLSR